MPFATSNVRRSAMGNFKVTAGDWSGTKADASGTITVEGGRVYLAEFNSTSPSTPTQIVPTSWAAGTATNTVLVTVHNRETTTTGTFIIIHA